MEDLEFKLILLTLQNETALIPGPVYDSNAKEMRPKFSLLKRSKDQVQITISMPFKDKPYIIKDMKNEEDARKALMSFVKLYAETYELTFVAMNEGVEFHE